MALESPQLCMCMGSGAESSERCELRWERASPGMQILMLTADRENPGSAENSADTECTHFVLALFCCSLAFFPVVYLSSSFI